MTSPARQPVSKRLQDITMYGVFLSVVSLLAGTVQILWVTVPTFLLLSAVLATGRYRHTSPRRKSYLELQQEHQKKIFCGCRDIYTRQQIYGF
jgi:cytochrome c-type biogenesis protein CcmH/NrfF